MNDADDESLPRRPWLVGFALLLGVGVAVVWWPGCRQYPAVSSPESLSLMKLVYSAANTKSPERLSAARIQFTRLRDVGKFTPAEQAAFETILADADAGRWKQAEDAAFRFAEDQIGLGRPDTVNIDETMPIKPAPLRR